MASKSSKNKIDLTLKLMLVFCLALLSFAVGTFVGKSITEKELSQTHYYKQRDLASTNTANENNEDTLSDAEINSLAQEFVESEKASETNMNRETASKDGYEEVHHEDIQETDLPEKTIKDDMSQREATEAESNKALRQDAALKTLPAAKRVANNKAPMNKRESGVRKPTSVLPELSQSLGKYTVQVVSYLNEKEASEKTKSLKAKGYTAFYTAAVVKKKTWYRVSIGLFKNSRKANKYKTDLLKKNQFSSALVRKIVE